METTKLDPSIEPEEAIRRLRNALSSIYHDTNNPLSIVSGNAQYFLELARVMEVDDELVQPVQDIEEAGERIATGLRRITALRDEIESYLGARNGDGT
ncbi:MAG: histidine kinase [Rhodothermales bacterium]